MRIKRLLFTTLLTVSSLIAFATDYYVATNNLKVRTGKGIAYSVSFTLQIGVEVEVLSTNNSWYRIKYMGRTGYVHSKYLNYSRTVSDIEVYTSQPQRNLSYLLIVIFLSLALLAIFSLVGAIRNRKLLRTVTELNRGERSERDLVLRLLKFGMPAHAIFHDLYVEKHKGSFSQIDLVAVTEVGILVFEVKDYSGWIFGSGNQYQWTQVLAYGKQKYRFYNPIMQNNKHLTELKKQLIQFGNIPFYSIIVFYGNCALKEINFVPDGTFLIKSGRVLDVVKLILEQKDAFHYNNLVEVFRVLQQAVLNGGVLENQILHKENIQEMLGKNRIFD